MAQFHLLDPHYDEHHRGRLTAEGEVLPVLRVRTHDRFLEEMRYDERYTPLLQRAGLDVLSYQVRRGLPTFNPAALTALVDRWRPETHTFHLPCGSTDRDRRRSRTSRRTIVITLMNGTSRGI
eukprot:XP_020404733.1 protein MAIN-LIKE 1-like [Zea mays]